MLSYTVRKKAFVELEKLGEAAERYLRPSISQATPEEMRRRLHQLPDALETKRSGPSLEDIRVVHAIEVLEWIGNQGRSSNY